MRLQDYLKLCLRVINEQRKTVLHIWDNHLLFMCRINENQTTQTSDPKKYEQKKTKKNHQEILREMFIEFLKQRKLDFSKKKVESIQITSQTVSNPIKSNLNTKFEFLLDKL